MLQTLLGVATTAIMVSGFLLGTRRCKKLNALLQTVAGAATNGTQCFYNRDHVFGVALMAHRNCPGSLSYPFALPINASSSRKKSPKLYLGCSAPGSSATNGTQCLQQQRQAMAGIVAPTTYFCSRGDNSGGRRSQQSDPRRRACDQRSQQRCSSLVAGGG
jgi:hypothetical protein